MQKLQDIAIRVEEATDGLPLNHSNATPIMHEILHALRKLEAQGETTTIDLRAIPFGPGDEDDLLKLLGHGEITVELDSLGKSHIRETAYSGVWLIDHRNAEDERIALQIEITQVPTIIRSQAEDMADAIMRLDDQLNPKRTEQAGR
jgi:hydrogenase-1 operon protein HyaF